MAVRALLMFFIAVLALRATPSPAQGEIWTMDIQDAIGPAIADYMVRGLQQAQDEGAQLVVLRIDTPGGLDTSMRQMIQAILAAKIPVVAYVSPQGARAASAGTYILYACHIAAMAPATNLGAATPVPLSGPEMPSLPGKDQQTPPSQSAMQHKIINDATAYIEGLAKLRGRNAEWAKQAVTEAVSLSAPEALQQHVIDLVADDMDDLLAQLDGREITVAHNIITLHTRNASVHRLQVDWRSKFLAIITNPNVAYILLIIGFYGLVLEFSNPGVGAGGIIGGVCLLLGLYAMQLLPISYSAFALLLLGLGLMVAEAFTPSFGILGLGGVISFVIGSIMLIDTELPGYQVALPIIMAFAAVSFGLLVIVLNLLFKARHKKVATGMTALEGKLATVTRNESDRLMVNVQGELWQASCDTPLTLGEKVKVAGVEGLKLKVQQEDSR